VAKKSNTAKDTGRIMFVSLFMILLAFFILLNAMATITEQKKQEAMQSVGGAFGFLPSGLSLQNQKEGPSPASRQLQLVQVQTQMMNQLRRMFTGEMGKGIKVTPAPTGEGAVLRIQSPQVFQGRSTEVPEELAQRLRQVGELVRGMDVSVKVRGHTALRPRSTLEEAWWVSGRRAQNVTRVLLDAGVAKDRIEVAGLGDTRPIAPETTREGRARNERIDVRIRLNEKTQLRPLFPGGQLAPAIQGGEG
jgi:chemotaxis protein MotB